MFFVQVDKLNPSNIKVILKGTPKTTNDLINFNAMQDNPAFNDYMNTKLNSKNMGVGLRDANEVNKETNRVSKILNLNPYQLSNYDFSNLNPQQRYEMDNLITYREQGLKSKVSDWMKKNLESLSAVVYSAGEVSKSLNSQDTGLIDATYNKINQYLGIGNTNELAKRTLTQSNYQLYANFMLKSLSGLAVTKPEEERFVKSFGSLYMSDMVTASKIKENMKSLAFRLQTMKRSYDPIAFNYRYGHLLRGVNRAVQRMDSVIQSYKKGTPNPNANYVNANGTAYQPKQQKTVKRTGTYNGRKVTEYSDGSVVYE